MRRLSKRTIASRANGALSRGPVTPEGKRKSSINALRHGLLSQCIVLENESEEHFDALLQQHANKFQPLDDVEQCAIEDMTAANWRLRRLWSIEATLFDEAVDKNPKPTERSRLAAAFSDLTATRELDLIDRYEARLHKMYQRALLNLVVLRRMDENSLLPNEPSCAEPVCNEEAIPEHS